jgi:hypothetical protein
MLTILRSFEIENASFCDYVYIANGLLSLRNSFFSFTGYSVLLLFIRTYSHDYFPLFFVNSGFDEDFLHV